MAECREREAHGLEGEKSSKVAMWCLTSRATTSAWSRPSNIRLACWRSDSSERKPNTTRSTRRRENDATLIVIDSDAELARARGLLDRLMASDDAAGITRLEARRAGSQPTKKQVAAPDAEHRRDRQLLMASTGFRAPAWCRASAPPAASAKSARQERLEHDQVQRLRARFACPRMRCCRGDESEAPASRSKAAPDAGLCSCLAKGAEGARLRA